MVCENENTCFYVQPMFVYIFFLLNKINPIQLTMQTRKIHFHLLPSERSSPSKHLFRVGIETVLGPSITRRNKKGRFSLSMSIS